MSVEKIVETLERLEKIHKSLLELAHKKTEFIKQNDMEHLDELIKNEQAHVAAIETFEQQRQAMVTDYLRAKGIALTDKPTVADVIAAASEHEPTERLVAVRERLMHVLEGLRKQNDLNQKLVFQSLQFINLTLDAMRPPREEQFNYSGAEVRRTNTVGKKTYYDSQA